MKMQINAINKVFTAIYVKYKLILTDRKRGLSYKYGNWITQVVSETSENQKIYKMSRAIHEGNKLEKMASFRLIIGIGEVYEDYKDDQHWDYRQPLSGWKDRTSAIYCFFWKPIHCLSDFWWTGFRKIVCSFDFGKTYGAEKFELMRWLTSLTSDDI